MARKVTLQAVNSFYNRIEGKFGNTKIENGFGATYMYLHGNLIAVLDAEGVLKVSNAGWFSNTTKERLNGLEGVSVVQRKGVWYLNGNEWDGNLVKVND